MEAERVSIAVPDVDYNSRDDTPAPKRPKLAVVAEAMPGVPRPTDDASVPLIPPGWRIARDPVTSKFYFYNIITRVVQWGLPGIGTAAAAAAATAAAAAAATVVGQSATPAGTESGAEPPTDSFTTLSVYKKIEVGSRVEIRNADLMHKYLVATVGEVVSIIKSHTGLGHETIFMVRINASDAYAAFIDSIENSHNAYRRYIQTGQVHLRFREFVGTDKELSTEKKLTSSDVGGTVAALPYGQESHIEGGVAGAVDRSQSASQTAHSRPSSRVMVAIEI